jgi:hypothetical protein
LGLPTSEQDWVTYLAQIHDQEARELKKLNDEYELRAVRSYMHPEILREVGDRLAQVVIAWPMLVVDSLEERLDVEGFRLADDDTADEDLWRVWQENDLDEESQLAHIDAMVMKRCYAAVGTNEDDPDTPLVTFESPLEVYADIDPRARKVRAALRRYSGYQGSLAREPEFYATLYLPDQTIYYQREGEFSGQYTETDRDQHGLGEVPIVPLINRTRLADYAGHSELAPILPLAHAANKIATDMMVAAEFLALPLRGVFGMGPEDLEDESGNKLTAIQAMLGRLLMIPNVDGNEKIFEFAAASLTNFTNVLDKIAQILASLGALPPHYLAFMPDNPASADAIRSGEIRLIKRAERKQRKLGGGHERTMRLVRRFQQGDWDPRLRRLETIWRDPSTPTVAQKADAAVKLFNLPQPIVPLEMTREKLGFTAAERARMDAEDAKEEARHAAMFKLPTAADRINGASNPTGNPGSPASPAAAG